MEPILIVGAVSVGLLLAKKRWAETPGNLLMRLSPRDLQVYLQVSECRSFGLLLSPPRGDSRSGRVPG